jgi:polyisoprenoid-binding protein YceI
MKIVLTLLGVAGLIATHPGESARPTVAGTAAAWKVDPVHSAVVFKIRHADISWFYGTFAVKQGSLTFDPANAADGSVEVSIDPASVATGNTSRDEHLRGPDFFDAKQFPVIVFAGKKLEAAGDGIAIEGELTLRGVTKPLKVTVTKTGEGEFRGPRVGYETTFTIKRSDFGLDYGVAKNQLGDEVTLIVSLQLVRDAAGGK